MYVNFTGKTQNTNTHLLNIKTKNNYDGQWSVVKCVVFLKKYKNISP